MQQIVSNKYLEVGTSEIAMKLISTSGSPDLSFLISVPDIFFLFIVILPVCLQVFLWGTVRKFSEVRQCYPRVSLSM